MPLLALRNEFILDFMSFYKRNSVLKDLFISVKFLKRIFSWDLEESLFEIEAEGFESGDYHVEICTTLSYETVGNKRLLTYEFSIRRK